MIKSKLTLSFLILFLSTIFVGCKPQEKPIVLDKKEVVTHKKVIKKSKVPAPLLTEQKEISETLPKEEQILKENQRSIIVNVTAEGLPVYDATVSLASRTSVGSFLLEKQTDNSGMAKFSISKFLPFFYVTAFSKDYAAVNIMKTGFSPTESSPITINLTLKEKGVIITAVLEDAPENINGFNARIERSKTQYGYPEIFVVSKNIENNKIKFPPISANLTGLRVCVDGDNIPQSYSKKFRTTDGENKEVRVEISMNVTLKGIASLPDGSPVTTPFLAIIRPLDPSKGASAEMQKQVTPKSDGSYEITGLSQGSFNVMFMHPNYNPFETTLILVPQETELNFSFEGLFILRGKVIHGYDQKPIEGIKVSQSHSENHGISDKDGLFEFEIQACNKDYAGRIVVDEPGYGRIDRDVRKNEKFLTIVLFQSGNIVGKVLTEDGTPVPNVRVSISEFENRDVNQSSFGCNTDSEGNFEFLNVKAPAKYGFRIFGNQHGYDLPSPYGNQGFIAEVKPEQTVECNLIVQRVGTFAIKAQDSNNKPVLDFEITPATKRKDGGSHSSFKRNVTLSDNEWYYLNSMICGDGLFSCTASENKNGLNVVTNNIPFSGGITNYITLIFSQTEPNLSGYVFRPDGSPPKNAHITIMIPSKNIFIHVNADNTGYFDVFAPEINEGEMMIVTASTPFGNVALETNLVSGSQNVKLILQEPNLIIGKVFLENLDTPAETFEVSIFHNNRSFNSADGSFVYELRKTSSQKGEMKITATGYLPAFVKFDSSKNSVCEVGNIVLKSGSPATIKGKIVDQNGAPQHTGVKLKYKKSGKIFKTYTKRKEGSFEFKDMLPGEATIFSKLKSGGSVSYNLRIEEGKNLELHDLVLTSTNSVIQ